MVRWSESATLKFVYYYKLHKCLWDPKDDMYTVKNARNSAYANLVLEMDLEDFDVRAAKVKIKNLRAHYFTELKKVRYAEAMGERYEPTLYWFKEMDAFLRDVIAHIPRLQQPETLLCDGRNLWQHGTCGSGISRDQCTTAVNQGADFEWMCQFPTEEKVNVEEDVANNMEVSAVKSENLEHVEGANFEVAVSNTMEVSAVSSENLEYFEGEIPNSSSSVEDPPPEGIPFGKNLVTYKKISSSLQRGRLKLIESTGYSYTLKRETTVSVHWRCVVRNKTMSCPATIKEVGNTFVRGPAEHCHPPETCSALKKKVSTLVKQKTVEDIFPPSSDIVDEAFQQHEVITADSIYDSSCIYEIAQTDMDEDSMGKASPIFHLGETSSSSSGGPAPFQKSRQPQRAPPAGNNRKRKRPNHNSNAGSGEPMDEFEAFGKSVAAQLRKLSISRALMAQTRIQTILTEERIQDLETTAPPPKPIPPPSVAAADSSSRTSASGSGSTADSGTESGVDGCSMGGLDGCGVGGSVLGLPSPPSLDQAAVTFSETIGASFHPAEKEKEKEKKKEEEESRKSEEAKSSNDVILKAECELITLDEDDPLEGIPSE